MATRAEVLRALGGEVADDDIREDFRELVRNLRTRYSGFAAGMREQAHRAPEVEFLLVYNSKFRSQVVLTDESGYVVILSLGAIYLICDLMRRLANVATFFPEIPGTTKLASLDHLVLDVSELRFEGVPCSLSRALADAARERLAHKMTIYALDFLVLHELGHVLHGHVALRKAQRLPVLQEVAEGAGTLVQQALEGDADAVATNRLLRWMRDAPYYFPPLHIVEVNGFLVSPISREQEVRVWWRGVYALLRLSAAKVSGTDLFSTHPTPQIRQIMIAANVLDHWAWTGLPNMTRDEICSFFAAGTVEVERACERFLADPGNQAGLKIATRQAGAHIGRVSDAYAAVYPLLLPHAHTDQLVVPERQPS